MKRILDRSFRYRPSFETDIRRTIAEFRRRERIDRAPADAKVTTLAFARARTERKK